VPAATAGQLLAVLDKQNAYLLSCTSSDQQQQDRPVAAGSSAAGLQLQLRLLSSCSVHGASNLQLSSVAWSDVSTVCVGDSEGGCQVLQVRLQCAGWGLHTARNQQGAYSATAHTVYCLLQGYSIGLHA
jgi:hypothetical protein